MIDRPSIELTHRWVPLAGALAVVATVATVAVSDLPDPDKRTAAQLAAYYRDHDGTAFAMFGVGLVVCVLLVVFATQLRAVLTGELLPRIVFAGGVIFATGIAIDLTIGVALAEGADHMDPVGVQALSVLYANDYAPFMLGIVLMLLPAGLAIVRQDVLPRWLGWPAIVLVLPAPTPLAWITIVGGMLWLLVASVVLWLRARPTRAPGRDVQAAHLPAR
jgi:hypothetical protein